MIRLGSPSISGDDIEAVSRVLASGQLVQGPEVKAFEEDLAALLGVKNVVAMSNCTSALEVALRALEIGPGDLVITSSYSWIATANVVEAVGATPVFVDIDPTTYNLDVDALRSVVWDLERSGDLTRVRALMPVHAFGYVADLDEIQKIAIEIGVPVLEDAACALGASLDGRPAGTIGAVGCFSFHPRKSVTSGEGGALVTNEDSIAQFARSFRNHGQVPGAPHEFGIFGHNYRLTDPMAALGRSQLSRLPTLLGRRREVMEIYLDRLQGSLELPAFEAERHAAQAFVAQLPSGIDRTKVTENLLEKGIETGTGTVAIPFAGPYRRKYGLTVRELPNLARIHPRTIALPLHADLSNEDADFVTSTLLDIVSSAES